MAISLIGSTIFYASSDPPKSISFVDSVFMAVSAMTLAGLNTVNLSILNTFQQIIMFFLIIIGSSIFISTAVVGVRRRAFKKKFQHVIKQQREERRVRRGSGLGPQLSFTRSLNNRRSGSRSRNEDPSSPIGHNDVEATGAEISMVGIQQKSEDEPSRPIKFPKDDTQTGEETPKARHGDENATAGITSQFQEDDHIRFVPSQASRRLSPQGSHSGILSMQGVGVHPTFMFSKHKPSLESNLTLGNRAIPKHPITNHTVKESLQRYIPSKALIGRNSSFYRLTPAQREQLGGVEYKAIKFLSILVPLYFFLWQLLGGLGVGAYVANYKADITEQNGLNPWWVGIFMAVSAFVRTLLSSMKSVQSALPDIVLCALDYGCNDPSRKYMIGNPATDSIPGIARVIDGLFQAFAVRSGGFYIISITSLRIGVQVLYVAMMYISVFPVVITMRNSNVYEERSLGIYSGDPAMEYGDPGANTITKSTSILNGLRKRFTSAPLQQQETTAYFVSQQLRAQLAHDLWWITIAVFLIMIIETGQFERDPATYSVFNVIFEVISGYASVGISTGLPDQAYSFSGGWHTLSKLILCAVMIRGRQRGLPVAIDQAVMLPSEQLAMAEEADARIRMEHAVSVGRAT
ncbi:MAG: hypothetical protein M1829_005190 [Trizodia sp. TS-e1964]|nr:MAG: hypothetical protein M1829_005190 [Trizodia sp. TS-e1964]